MTASPNHIPVTLNIHEPGRMHRTAAAVGPGLELSTSHVENVSWVPRAYDRHPAPPSPVSEQPTPAYTHMPRRHSQLLTELWA